MNMTVVTLMLVLIFFLLIQTTGQNLEQTSLLAMNQIGIGTVNMGYTPPFLSVRLNPAGLILESDSNFYNLNDVDDIHKLIHESLSVSKSHGILREEGLRFLKLNRHGEQILIFSDISTELAAMENLTRNCIIIGVFSFLLFLLFSILFANWAVKPVECAWEQQKQFIADASHQLKTPLTVILTNAELLHDEAMISKQSRQLADVILSKAGQMKKLINGLLDLSHFESDSFRSLYTETDYSKLIAGCACQFEPLYYESGLSLETDIQPAIMVKGNVSALQQAADILLDNALKYATPGSAVKVTLHGRNRHSILSVAAEGEPISSENLKKIFHRFYRIDPTRNKTDSYGLGLAIAQSIVLQHDGKIWAESCSGVNTFFIQLHRTL